MQGNLLMTSLLKQKQISKAIGEKFVNFKRTQPSNFYKPNFISSLEVNFDRKIGGDLQMHTNVEL